MILRFTLRSIDGSQLESELAAALGHPTPLSILASGEIGVSAEPSEANAITAVISAHRPKRRRFRRGKAQASSYLGPELVIVSHRRRKRPKYRYRQGFSTGRRPIPASGGISSGGSDG